MPGFFLSASSPCGYRRLETGGIQVHGAAVKHMLKIAIIKGVIASYSEGFYDRLFSHSDLFVRVYCQDHIPGMDLKTVHHKYANNVKLLKFISLKNDKLSWQCIPWKEILRGYDIVFIQGNPRNLSQLLFATYLRLIGRKVILWTQGHSFQSNAITENIRLLWSRMFRFLLLYTDAEVSYLRRKGFTSNYMLGQNNGLDQRRIESAILLWNDHRSNEWRKQHDLENRFLILSCARLSAKNKLCQFVQALPKIIVQIPNVMWCIIGSGKEKAELTSMVFDFGVADHVRFVGELYDEEDLAPWFLSSHIFVHPAAIGLSMMHAFGYGLPVITHGNAYRQGPEYGAFEAEVTGRTFEQDNIQSLSDAVITLLKDEDARLRMKHNVKKIAREDYNVDVMVERFIKIARQAYAS